MSSIRFLLDEHIRKVIARELRRDGIDVVSSGDAGLLGAPDTAYLSLGNAESRVVVTFDWDFVELHYAGVEHAGLIYFDPRSRSIGAVVEALRLVSRTLDAEDMLGQLEKF